MKVNLIYSGDNNSLNEIIITYLFTVINGELNV